MKKNLSIAFLLIMFFGLSETVRGQVVSTLPDSGAAILQQITAYGVVQNSVLLVGRFTSTSQVLDDFATFRQDGSISCLSNTGDGFAEPQISSTGIAPPLTAFEVINLGSTPRLDSILVANSGNVYLLTMENCIVTSNQLLTTNQVLTSSEVLTVSPPVPVAGVVSISTVIPNLLSLDSGVILATPTVLYIYDLATTEVPVLIPPIPATTPPAPPYGPAPIGAEYVQAGFGQYAFVMSQIPPNSPDANSNAAFANVSDGNLILPNPNPFNDVSGASILGFIPTTAGLVAASSWTNCPDCTVAQVFLDGISLNGQIAVTNITSFGLSGQPIGMAVGNFLGNQFDLAIATNFSGGENVFISAYIPGGTPQWTVNASSFNAGGVVSAISHGSFVTPGEDDIIVQTPAGAVINASVSLTEPTPALQFTPSTLTFSNTQVGSTSVQTVTVTSVGTLAATVSSIETSGYPPFSYVSSDCRNQEVVGSSCTVTVGFTPTVAGTLTGSLNLYSAGNQSLQNNGVLAGSVPLVGVATATAPPPPTPTISVTPVSQSCVAGCIATYQLAASNFSSNPTLSVSANIPKGGCTASAMVVTCSTTASTSALSSSRNPSWAVTAFLILVLVWISLPRHRVRSALALASLLVLSACGGATSSRVPPVTTPGTPANTYQIQVSATTANQSAQVTAQLRVE
jgi:HYDIN/CFA65/VesB family protein